MQVLAEGEADGKRTSLWLGAATQTVMAGAHVRRAQQQPVSVSVCLLEAGVHCVLLCMIQHLTCKASTLRLNCIYSLNK